MAVPVDPASREADTLRAARQAGLLFLVTAVLSLVAITSLPDRRDPLFLLAASDLVIAVVTFVLPWRRWPAGSTAVLAVVAWTVIGASTWTIGGIGSGSGAFFVLAFAWMGLHHSRRTILLNAPVAAFAYLVALVLSDTTRQALAGTVLVIPFAVSIALIIEGRVRRLRAAREVIEEEQRWRAALMATLAHDVRSPLTTIESVLEIIAEDPGLPVDLKPLVAAAVRQTSRLSTLATTARPRAGRGPQADLGLARRRRGAALASSRGAAGQHRRDRRRRTGAHRPRRPRASAADDGQPRCQCPAARPASDRDRRAVGGRRGRDVRPGPVPAYR